MNIRLGDSAFRKMKSAINGIEMEVGILTDKPHMQAKRGARGSGGSDVLKQFYGKQARKVTRKKSGLTVSQVSKSFREQTGINIFKDPFRNKKNKELLLLVKNFMSYAFGRSSIKRLENSVQALIRNPMLRGDYGSNSTLTKKIKGFNHKGVDTGQLFDSIKAKVTRSSK